MSSWTRYKYEKTKLPDHLVSKNRASALKEGGGGKRNSNNREERQEEKTDNETEKDSNNTNSNDKKEGESEIDKKTKGKDKTAKNKSKLPAWALRHSTAEVKCPNCRNGGSPLNDPKAGRIVCIECGLVLQVGFISEQSEWRNFADSDKSGPDPNRVGSAGHYLLNDVDDLSTKVGDGSYLQNLQQSTTNSNVSQKLISAIRNFERQGKELGLTKDTQNCAGMFAFSFFFFFLSSLHINLFFFLFLGEIFKDLLECEELRSRQMKSKQAISMYMASKMCHSPRPFKEICQYFNVDHKTVRKLHSEVFKLISMSKLNLAKHRKQNTSLQYGRNNIHEKKQSTIEVYALRYASKLQCDKKKINKLLKSIVYNMEHKFEFSKNRQPTSMAAACVFFAAMMMSDNEKERRSYKEISAVSGVSQSTLQDIYRRQIYPNRKKLIPSFADEVRAGNLPLK